MKKITTKRYDAHSHQIFADDAFIGTAVAYGMKRWWFHDKNDVKIAIYGGHATPKNLATHLSTRIDGAAA